MDQEFREVFADVKTALSKYAELVELQHLLIKEVSVLQFMLTDIAHELGMPHTKINDLRKQAEAKRSLLKITREITGQTDAKSSES